MDKKPPIPSADELKKAVTLEAKAFESTLLWLTTNMPSEFFSAIDSETHPLIARNLLSFKSLNYFIPIQLKDKLIVICQKNSDEKIFDIVKNHAHLTYHSYLSKVPYENHHLKITLIHFTSEKELSSNEKAMLERAKTREQCQYVANKNTIELAWKNTTPAQLLPALITLLTQYSLTLETLHCTKKETILVLSFSFTLEHSFNLKQFLKDLVLLNHILAKDEISTLFSHCHHLVRNFISFTHQVLCLKDPNMYSLSQVTEGHIRHPELTQKLCELFALKFDPETHNLEHFEKEKRELISLIDKIDTGQAINDCRRKTILKQTLNFITHTLKTNFYRTNKSAFAFRLDPKYMDLAPFDRKEKFPELPFAIFFIRGNRFLGFNIRFKDLARGGVRTVVPQKMEQYLQEQTNIFSESYNLAYTQQKKNKDIPEGGAKTAILLEPCDSACPEERLNTIYSAQKSFIESFMSLINCDDDGNLRAKSILDYWKKPEYIYLGPDENMFNDMIVWIAAYAVSKNYKPGRSFMSSKPGAGINHKEYGVTSYGVNVYLHETLLFLGINPTKDRFTIKISGGPDGDVAGNEIVNLHKYYPKTAKLLALTDVSGTIYDPEGLDLEEMVNLFKTSSPIRSYPAEKLHNGGFLLDVKTKKALAEGEEETLITRKKENKTVQEWLSPNEMNLLYRNNVHQVKTDIFVPGGGRPKTLNETNYTSFLDVAGKPTSKAIVEGANLYLTPGARRALEERGVIIIKDSSCNKGGVICSSFEVLASLCMSEEQFIQEKTQYVKEVLDLIGKAALNEANLLLSTHKETNQFLTDISDLISEKINLFKYQLLEHLMPLDLSKDQTLLKCLLHYCPPLLQSKYKAAILAMPDIHKKAVIACYLASHLVYKRGLSWNPNIADVLPTIAQEFGH